MQTMPKHGISLAHISPSVTLVYRMETAKHITRFSQPVTHTILVSRAYPVLPIYKGNPSVGP